MYKVVIYSLCALITESFIVSALHLSQQSLGSLLISFAVIALVAMTTHTLLKKLFKAPANSESTYISAFLLFLILAPIDSGRGAIYVALTTFITIASKYYIAHKHRHIFNPVAFGIFIAGLMGAPIVIWWVGSAYYLPLMIIVAVLVIRKLKRHTLFFSYLTASLLTIVVLACIRHENIIDAISQQIISWPLLFLGAFMLTEPLTTPPTKKLQGIYGVLVGVLSSVPFSLPPLYSSPEFALLLGNCFSYAVSTKSRISLTLTEVITLAEETFEFVFKPSERVSYRSGQYMEWTLNHTQADTRGIRRYFTIVSSPEDHQIRLSVRRVEGGSSFKKHLFAMKPGAKLTATAVSGDFVLPDKTEEKLVFIAGGIGITPFISMIRSMISRHEMRDITLFYANKIEQEIAYKQLLDEASSVGVKTVYILSDEAKLRTSWEGEKGFVTDAMLTRSVPDVLNRKYYISGPPGMVAAYETLLLKMGVSRSAIVTDFFPGLS